MTPTAPKLSDDQIADLLRRADLDLADWDPPRIAARANKWIANNHTELTHSDVKTWSAQLQAKHYDEFGSIAAVEFFEQCVIETAPDGAPCRDLRGRVDAGDFDTWQPVWVAAKP